MIDVAQGDPRFPYWGRYWTTTDLDGKPGDIIGVHGEREQLYLALAAMADIESEMSGLLVGQLGGTERLAKFVGGLSFGRLRQWIQALELTSEEVVNDINLLWRARSHVAHGAERSIADPVVRDTLLTLKTSDGTGLSVGASQMKIRIDGSWLPLTAVRLLDSLGNWGAFLYTAQRLLRQLYFDRTGEKPGYLPPDYSEKAHSISDRI